MVDADPVVAAPGGASGPAIQAALDEMDEVLSLLRGIAAAEVVPGDLREDAARAAEDAAGALGARPVRVRVLAGEPGAACAWLARQVGAPVVSPGTDGPSVQAWWADEPLLEVTRQDGARFDLEGLSPDPGPELRSERDAARARLRDVDEARRGVREDLDRDSARLLEKTDRKAAVERDLEEERAALAEARERIGALEAEKTASAAYLVACESTVPAVLRREPAGLLDRILHALLPILFGTDVVKWRGAVEGQAAVEASVEAARVAAAEAETRLIRLRRERVALMNETVRLQGEVGELRTQLGALDGEHDAVSARLVSVRGTLEGLPDARRAAWASHARAHAAAAETRSVCLAGPDVRLPKGLALCLGPEVPADLPLLLPGPPPADLAQQVGAVLLVLGGPEARGTAARAAALPADRVWAVADADDMAGLTAAASRAAVRAAAGRLAGRSDHLDDAITRAAVASRELDGARAAALAALPDRWPGSFTGDALARTADARVTAAEALLHEAAATVPPALDGAWSAVTAGLDGLDEAVALRDASEALAGALQARVDGAAQAVAGRLAAGAAAWIDGAVAALLAPEAEALAAAGASAPPPPTTGRVGLVGVVPDIQVDALAGRLGGPLLRLRSIQHLREEATAGIRSATEQATVQLQARLLGASSDLAGVLEAGLRSGLDAGRQALLAAAQAAAAAHAAEAGSRAGALQAVEDEARRLRAHARALAQAAGDIRPA
jgi:hypothetical protein